MVSSDGLMSTKDISRSKCAMSWSIWSGFVYDGITIVPEADKNLLVKIMKRRECAKRKKSNTPEMEMEGDADEEIKETTKKPDKPQAPLDVHTRTRCMMVRETLVTTLTRKRTVQLARRRKRGRRSDMGRMRGSRKMAMLYWFSPLSAFKSSNGKLVIEERDSNSDGAAENSDEEME